MKVRVDVDKCVASGHCVVACPEVFAQDDEGLVVVLDESPTDELLEKIDEAISVCPAACIWRED